MAKFDESKVINALHPERAEVGKVYFHSDELLDLKDDVENDGHHEKLVEIDTDLYSSFVMELGASFQFLYPYEEPKQRMTNRQLAEWLARGNGEQTKDNFRYTFILHEYYKGDEDKEVDKGYLIRPFGQTEWIEPTYEIYIKDCKGD